MDYPQHILCTADTTSFSQNPNTNSVFCTYLTILSNAIEAQIDSTEVTIVVELTFEVVRSRVQGFWPDIQKPRRMENAVRDI